MDGGGQEDTHFLDYEHSPDLVLVRPRSVPFTTDTNSTNNGSARHLSRIDRGVGRTWGNGLKPYVSVHTQRDPFSDTGDSSKDFPDLEGEWGLILGGKRVFWVPGSLFSAERYSSFRRRSREGLMVEGHGGRGCVGVPEGEEDTESRVGTTGGLAKGLTCVLETEVWER